MGNRWQNWAGLQAHFVADAATGQDRKTVLKSAGFEDQCLTEAASAGEKPNRSRLKTTV